MHNPLPALRIPGLNCQSIRVTDSTRSTPATKWAPALSYERALLWGGLFEGSKHHRGVGFTRANIFFGQYGRPFSICLSRAYARVLGIKSDSLFMLCYGNAKLLYSLHVDKLICLTGPREHRKNILRADVPVMLPCFNFLEAHRIETPCDLSWNPFSLMFGLERMLSSLSFAYNYGPLLVFKASAERSKR